LEKAHRPPSNRTAVIFTVSGSDAETASAFKPGFNCGPSSSLQHNLGLKVVAEGNETEKRINLPKQFNREMVQGYFFSPPADDLTMLKPLAGNRSASAAAVGGQKSAK
jgi:hypothetical protein